MKILIFFISKHLNYNVQHERLVSVWKKTKLYFGFDFFMVVFIVGLQKNWNFYWKFLVKIVSIWIVPKLFVRYQILFTNWVLGQIHIANQLPTAVYSNSCHSFAVFFVATNFMMDLYVFLSSLAKWTKNMPNQSSYLH